MLVENKVGIAPLPDGDRRVVDELVHCPKIKRHKAVGLEIRKIPFQQFVQGRGQIELGQQAAPAHRAFTIQPRRILTHQGFEGPPPLHFVVGLQIHAFRGAVVQSTLRSFYIFLNHHPSRAVEAHRGTDVGRVVEVVG